MNARDFSPAGHSEGGCAPRPAIVNRKPRWDFPRSVEILESERELAFRCDGEHYALRTLQQGDCVTVAAWLANPSLNAWMDFGHGRRELSAMSLRVMASSPDHFVRTVVDANGRPIGVFGLQQINNPFRVAQIWGIRPMLRPPARLRITVAMRIVLSVALRKHDLSSIQAWAVDGNLRSIRCLEELGFRACGRQRRCHPIGSEIRDRLLFDLLPEEFEPYEASAQSDRLAGRAAPAQFAAPSGAGADRRESAHV